MECTVYVYLPKPQFPLCYVMLFGTIKSIKTFLSAVLSSYIAWICTKCIIIVY